MGICWGSPDFPTPSSRAVCKGKDLTLSSTTSVTASSVAVSHNTSSAAVSNNASSVAVSNNASSVAVSNDASSAVISNISKSQVRDSTMEPESEYPVHHLKVFEYEELRTLTKNFEYELSDCGERIYRGWLRENNSEIAVQILGLPNNLSHLHGTIISEIQLFSSLSHPNLMSLLGYCLIDKQILLIYESSESCASLEDRLFNSPSSAQGLKNDALSWDTRLQIAIEVAKGLNFLHTMDVVFLRYFGSSHILLDKFFQVKVTGLNFLLDDARAAQQTAIKNVKASKATAAELQRQQDVYDFGVVLLELLTGLPLGRSRWQSEYSLRIEWIKQRILNKGSLSVVMDSQLQVSHDVPFSVARVALCCLDLNPLQRPHIAEVFQTLNQIKDSDVSSQLFFHDLTP